MSFSSLKSDSAGEDRATLGTILTLKKGFSAADFLDNIVVNR
jgi:hypothetical protein